MSRDKILANVLKNQPENVDLPDDLIFEEIEKIDLVNKFIEMITLIGGQIIRVNAIAEIDNYIKANIHETSEKIVRIPELANFKTFTGLELPHQFELTEFAIFKPHFAVAENGAVWLTEDQMGHRVLPFITQHLAMIVETKDIVANMHDAYQLIDQGDYGFGTFIAGPSKTADIEQSLVLGAHGARSMTIFLI
jgi:L-lactate dehydrogenase complex protein LldG